MDDDTAAAWAVARARSGPVSGASSSGSGAVRCIDLMGMLGGGDICSSCASVSAPRLTGIATRIGDGERISGVGGVGLFGGCGGGVGNDRVSCSCSADCLGR